MKDDSGLSITEKLLAYAFGLIVVTAVVLAFNCIPYFLWNYFLSPTFGWRHFTFWQIFLLVWCISLVGGLVFNRGSK